MSILILNAWRYKKARFFSVTTVHLEQNTTICDTWLCKPMATTTTSILKIKMRKKKIITNKKSDN